MTGILEQLKLESVKKRRENRKLIMLYKSLKNAASLPMDDLVPPNRHLLVQFLPTDYERL